MDRGTKHELEQLCSFCPGLRNDNDFKITSPCDYDYNCIAWSLYAKCPFKWPFPKEYDILDGMEYWPEGLPRNEFPETFLAMYRLEGFEQCEETDIEEGFLKVALYLNNDGKITHAARQLPSGMWTSKLGQLNDIQHSTPYSLEGEIYGRVTYILKKKI